MRPDNYQYRQGRQHALDILGNAQSTLSEKTLLGDLIRNLTDGCRNKPQSFADGIRSIVKLLEAE